MGDVVDGIACADVVCQAGAHRLCGGPPPPRRLSFQPLQHRPLVGSDAWWSATVARMQGR